MQFPLAFGGGMNHETLTRLPDRFRTALVKAAMVIAGVAGMEADEGMWLFNAPPRGLFRERYEMDLAEPWLDRLQKSSVRFNRAAKRRRDAVSRGQVSPVSVQEIHGGAPGLRAGGADCIFWR